MSRERFTPAAAAGAVIFTYLRVPAPSILCLAAPPTRKECVVYRASSMRAVRRRVSRLVAICAGVNASSPISPPSRTLGNGNPDPSARVWGYGKALRALGEVFEKSGRKPKEYAFNC